MRSKTEFVGFFEHLPVFALVALLVGCSSGSSNPTGGGGAGGKAGAGGHAGGAGNGAAGAAGATGIAGAGGASGAGGGAGAAGGVGAAGGAGAAGGGGAGGGAGTGGAAGGGGGGGKAGAGGTGGLGGAGGGAGAAGAAGQPAVDAGTHPTDAGCQGVDLPGSGVPVGTVATASNTLSIDGGLTYGPSNVIDGDVTTEWISGTNNAWLTLTFPAPVMISAIRLHADALPETVEIYSLSTSTTNVTLGHASLPVKLAPGGVLPDIQVTPGTYSNITISVDGGASWVGIDEVWLLASPACP